MNKENKIITILLVMILVVSLRSWSNTKNLENKLQQVNREIDLVRQSVSSEVSGIRSTVEGIRNDARWWGQSKFDFIKRDNNQIDLRVGWHLQDYSQGSEVVLNYRFDGEEGFKEIKTQREADGYFTAIIPIEIEGGPSWQLGMSRIGAAKKNRGTEGFMEPIWDEQVGGHEYLEHYIVIKEEGNIKSSETVNVGMGHINAQLFGVIDGSVEFNENENTINVDLDAKIIYQDTAHQIESFQLQTRNKTGTVIEKWDSNLVREGVAFRIEAKPEKEYDTVCLVAIYSNGKKFEKLIGPIF